MAYATTLDVADELGHDIQDNTPESRQITKWIERAERTIRLRVPILDQWCTDPDYLATVIDIESAAVARKALNPEGIRTIMTQIDDANLQKTIDTTRSTGEITILDTEWELLMRTPASEFGTLTAQTDPQPIPYPHYPPAY
ncbi:hypothetical protein [Bifidobacterium samirii]|uniref:Phage protein Gp19/Gp15/Gp42 n=1 Tax=Bifidobacterium samirii TaxID=2306974 RepID=A0A430FUD4_9BIFI|nr:hypothetical protein [Bifidobacterium samirii]RSX56769.1 phage protein Gp19/Gp15/Gp42 [Bifidobacterium samirii]